MFPNSLRKVPFGSSRWLCVALSAQASTVLILAQSEGASTPNQSDYCLMSPDADSLANANPHSHHLTWSIHSSNGVKLDMASRSACSDWYSLISKNAPGSTSRIAGSSYSLLYQRS